METLKGMSVGAMVPVLELFAINAFEELEPMLEAPEGGLLFLQRKEGYLAPPKPPVTERCSSFAMAVPGSTILAHNEHWLAGDLGNVAVVLDAPDDRPIRIASPTVVCCLPAVGVNSRGGAQGIGSLTASDDEVGVPRVLVSRNSLEAADRADAIERAGIAARAGGYGHTFAFAGETPSWSRPPAGAWPWWRELPRSTRTTTWTPSSPPWGRRRPRAASPGASGCPS
jgi:hypothetical protein